MGNEFISWRLPTPLVSFTHYKYYISRGALQKSCSGGCVGASHFKQTGCSNWSWLEGNPIFAKALARDPKSYSNPSPNQVFLCLNLTSIQSKHRHVIKHNYFCAMINNTLNEQRNKSHESLTNVGLLCRHDPFSCFKEVGFNHRLYQSDIYLSLRF